MRQRGTSAAGESRRSTPACVTSEVITDVITVKSVAVVQTRRELLVHFRATCLQPEDRVFRKCGSPLSAAGGLRQIIFGFILTFIKLLPVSAAPKGNVSVFPCDHLFVWSSQHRTCQHFCSSPPCRVRSGRICQLGPLLKLVRGMHTWSGPASGHGSETLAWRYEVRCCISDG